eukprot:s865_g11.t1
MRFLGNPGTGKTVVARIVGEMMVKMGVVAMPEEQQKKLEAEAKNRSKEAGHGVPTELVFREASRADLVAQYLGQTAPKVEKAVENALGGVLFIDEAYALVREGKDTFGQEAVDTLIKEMEDKRKNVIVILAGYESEMDTFFDSNPGFKSRVPFSFRFEDYSCNELGQIGNLVLSSQGLAVPPQVGTQFVDLISFASGCCNNVADADCHPSRDNGNGRTVRNVVEALQRAMAKRVVRDGGRSAEELGTLKAADVVAVAEEQAKTRLEGPCGQDGLLYKLAHAANQEAGLRSWFHEYKLSDPRMQLHRMVRETGRLTKTMSSFQSPLLEKLKSTCSAGLAKLVRRMDRKIHVTCDESLPALSSKMSESNQMTVAEFESAMRKVEITSKEAVLLLKLLNVEDTPAPLDALQVKVENCEPRLDELKATAGVRVDGGARNGWRWAYRARPEGWKVKNRGVDELCSVMTPNPAMVNETHVKSVAEVVGYVGLIMKERGMVLEASRLYRKALVLAPDHGSLCLNLMHTFALRRDDIRGLAWARKFFGLLARKIPRVAALNRALLSEEPDTSQKMFSSRDFPAENEFRDAIAIGFVVLKLLFLAHPRTALPFCQEGDGRPSWQQRLRDVEVSEEIVGPQVASLLDDSWRRPPEAVNAGAPRLGAIAAHDQVLRWLVALLGKCVEGLELHLTAVRNENAYFNCIKDILALKGPATIPRSPALFKPLYVIGDSHVLPTSWQTVEFTTSRGSYHYVLIPMLVTGLKIWHLRDESNFYTKFAFWDKLSVLPVEAPVMFILGEIDCREGVLKAVQKGKHESVEDALYLLIGHYTEVLKRIRRKLVHNDLFLHPVPTVLPETRFLTMAFNSLLSAAPCQAALAKVRVKLLTLDCIYEGGPQAVAGRRGTELSRLNVLPELRLDGTHLSPSYVQTHLAPAMQRTMET